MGGMAGALGSMASVEGGTMGSIAGAAGKVVSGLDSAEKYGDTIDFVSEAEKDGQEYGRENAISPVSDSAKEAGKNTFSGAKNFLAQGWENAKKDFGEKLDNIVDNIVVKDESGNIDGWKTAGNAAYHGGKALLASSFSGGGNGGQDAFSQAPAQTAPVQNADTSENPDAEEELNKLRNKMNA